MADRPFGFGLPDKPEDQGGQGSGGSGGPGGSGGFPGAGGPMGGPFGGMGNPQQFADALRQFADMLSWQGGPVNWDLAKNVARHAIVAAGDPSVLDAQRRDITEAVRQALGALGGPGGLGPMMRQMGGAMIGSQTGTAVGELAREVIGSADVGLPLGPEGTAALLPAGVAEFSQGLSVDAGEVRLFLALREAAHQRLFAHVPWLRAHLLGAVEQYASGISVDMARLQEAIPDVDITNPEALSEALSGEGLFRPEDTPAQKAALTRLETALALVEGWVATVVSAAATERLTHADALAEAIRRRRATGGPAERTFATLVGLELRPRRLREATAIWQGLTEARGIDGRDALWAHPDLLPAADDLENPDAFVRGQPEFDISDLENPEQDSSDPDSSDPDSRGDG